MPGRRQPRVPQSQRLLEALSAYDRFLVVMHDNPDPDAIAAGWAVRVLICEKLGRPVRVVGGGAIVRAENRYMVALLKPPIELVNDIDLTDGTAALLVDCASESTNHLLMRKATRPVGVIDHHLDGAPAAPVAFHDVRPNVVASATIAASYLREQRIEPGTKLATAMLYAMRTETRGNDTRHSRLDRLILSWLTERADPAVVAAIENAPLSRAYFGDLVLAMQHTFLYDGAAWCFLPRVEGAEIVGEVADLLIRCVNVDRVLCAAVVVDDVLLSARTERDAGNAAVLLRQTLEGLGTGGGHAHRAGGKIPNALRAGRAAERVEDGLRKRWLTACGVELKRGARLVPKREIMKNL